MPKYCITFFELDAITKKQMKKLHTATVGNPTVRMPGGVPFPTLLGITPGVEAVVPAMMKSRMEQLDIPTTEEFLELVTAGGGEICAGKLAVDMFGLKKEDLSEHVIDIITIGQFYQLWQVKEHRLFLHNKADHYYKKTGMKTLLFYLG